MKTPQSPGRFGQARKGVLLYLPEYSGVRVVPGDMAIMSTLPVCAGRDDKGCSSTSTAPTLLENVDWLEKDVAGFRVWQIMFMSFAGVLALVIFLCCCIRFRIPRTKQEIEADYVRKKITRKFKKHLRFIQNSEMDDMDLKRALDRVRAEFKSDTESIAPSEALSGATLSSGCNCPLPGPEEPRDVEGGKGHLLPPSADDNTYCKGSDILIGDEEEERAEVPQKGIGAKFATLVENTLVKFRAKKSSAE